MKKITLLTFVLFIMQLGNAQQTISFETSEGYSVGDLLGQNGWITTPTGSNSYVENQSIINTAASDGEQSLRIAVDDRYGWQEESGPIIGGIYALTTPLSFKNTSVSFDVYIDDEIGNASTYRFGTVALSAGVYSTIVDFEFNGSIYVLANNGFIELSETWKVKTWYTIRMDITADTITYFINDTPVSESVLIGGEDLSIDEIRFVHDNYNLTGFALLDNLKINQTLSTGSSEMADFTHFYDKNSDILKLTSGTSAFESLKVYNNPGQAAMAVQLHSSEEQINLSGLQAGVYLVKVTMDGKSKTLKIVKQ